MKIVVVGHGMVGHKFLEGLDEAGVCDAQVTVLCEEPRPAYDRVHLSEFFGGRSADDLSLVPAGFFRAAVRDGAVTVGALKTCTRAGTTCGGCVPLVTQTMKAAMKRQGLAVDNRLCEHFAHSRQALYHLVKVEGIRTFGELLARHGRGLGCDICKPVAASIFASCWNDFVLSREHAALQDSNDYFLGNIQKDGTYSVVPRMPAGEVTPDGLMAVARVAKKYGLYTKITGGQRVDLFGARVDQLPAIWEELIAANLDKEQLVRLIDRFLMCYVRTADRLQRTSTWRENLEGGLAYLQQVVVEDSLGIGAELEADMQRLVDTYACEWKAAVTDPQTRKRFRQFVNSDQPDPNVVFVTERKQIRPARPQERAARSPEQQPA